ncbi:retrovirus-related pol polyprotein from transposon TNT 1-94 [Tanacetum coccineum]|uniref:Retrovirus-related pol polyprotein from transposon TNT 1-94 n=1 Tax=Tanacetum coccineum TaxID=301880 RepID=A0ABQ5CWE0_9ASTR
MWKVIQYGDFVFEMEDPETKMIKEMPYELHKDDEKKKLGKNNEAKMTPYNTLPCNEYERVFMSKTSNEVWHTLIITHRGNSHVKDCKIDLLTQLYEKFSILSKETIDCGFTRFNSIVTSLKSLDQDYSNKNHLIGNLKVDEMVLENNVLVSKTTKEKVKSIALKAKVTMEQTSDDSDSQGGSDEDPEKDEDKAEAFNLMARKFQKFFHKSVGSSKQKRGCYNCEEEGHFIGECPKPKENIAFIGGAWRDSEEGDEPQMDVTCLMVIDSQEVHPEPSISNNDLEIIDLQKENKELLKFNKDFTKTYQKLLTEKRSLENERSKLLSKVESLKSNVSKLQDEALNSSKFKKSSFVLDDMLSSQKFSLDKEGVGFYENKRTTSGRWWLQGGKKVLELPLWDVVGMEMG